MTERLEVDERMRFSDSSMPTGSGAGQQLAGAKLQNMVKNDLMTSIDFQALNAKQRPSVVSGSDTHSNYFD